MPRPTSTDRRQAICRDYSVLGLAATARKHGVSTDTVYRAVGRSHCVTLRLAPYEMELLQDAARKHDLPVCTITTRLLVEVLDRGMIDKLLAD